MFSKDARFRAANPQFNNVLECLFVDMTSKSIHEATSNLDNQSAAFIQKSLNTLMQNRTTFVIGHRISTIQQADQILVVEE